MVNKDRSKRADKKRERNYEGSLLKKSSTLHDTFEVIASAGSTSYVWNHTKLTNEPRKRF